ncbi:MAG: prolyl oligopeptidase family serine peptidase, partial [Acidobacteriota bacterium]
APEASVVPRIPGFEAATENIRTAAELDSELRSQIYREILRRSETLDFSVPAPDGPFLYYSRQGYDDAYSVFCRRPASGGDEEILLDRNELAQGHTYSAVRVLSLSPDHQRLVYGVDHRGDERWELWLQDLEAPRPSARLLARNAGPTAAWANDNQTLFYTRLDASHRAYRLYRRHFGESASPEVLLYEEDDPAFKLRVSRTESGGFLILAASCPDTTEVRYLSADEPWGVFMWIQERIQGVRLAVTHHADHFYLLSNHRGHNFELVKVPIDAIGQENWRSLMPHRDDAQLESLQAFEKHLVVYERHEGLHRVAVLRFEDETLSYLPLPSPTGVVSRSENRRFRTSALRFGFSSLTTPFSTYEMDLNSGALSLLKPTSAGPGFDPRNYRSERMTATGADGSRIPMTFVYRKDRRQRGGNPLLLHGYGAYGYCLEPGFDAARLSLLDRGCIYAIAHVRGGGEKGKRWHEDGMKLSKRNSVDDFIACARALIAQGVAAPGQVAALGESAGGLLVASAFQREPELFAAVIADCPFIDVIGALRESALPLTVADWREWGNPASDIVHDYMRTYAPLETLESGPLPAVLILTGLNDPWAPWEQAVAWALKVRKATTSGRPVLIHVDGQSGHRGPSARPDFAQETALKYAFLVQHLDLPRAIPRTPNRAAPGGRNRSR